MKDPKRIRIRIKIPTKNDLRYKIFTASPWIIGGAVFHGFFFRGNMLMEFDLKKFKYMRFCLENPFKKVYNIYVK